MKKNILFLGLLLGTAQLFCADGETLAEIEDDIAEEQEKISEDFAAAVQKLLELATSDKDRKTIANAIIKFMTEYEKRLSKDHKNESSWIFALLDQLSRQVKTDKKNFAHYAAGYIRNNGGIQKALLGTVREDYEENKGAGYPWGIGSVFKALPKIERK